MSDVFYTSSEHPSVTTLYGAQVRSRPNTFRSEDQSLTTALEHADGVEARTDLNRPSFR